MTSLSRRKFMQATATAGLFTSSLAIPGRSLWANAANEQIGIGFIGCGGRAKTLMEAFDNVEGAVTAAVCDPDAKRIEKAKARYPKAEGYADLRELLKDDNVDAVVIATCNHWHCLAAIWAMEAGKHVWVEKPLSHSQWEGEQTVAAARKYNRICQIGTQQRSDPMQSEIKDFLHHQKVLGEIQSARVNRYGIRKPIGKLQSPLQTPKTVNYDLWLGPAADVPIYRRAFHYDWHWNFNTGSGEMGNWGVHMLDDVRNVIFQDKVSLPKRIMGGGGRVAWDDAGETPNVHFIYFDTGEIPVVIGLSNLPNEPATTGDSSKKQAPTKHPGPASGYIAYCEGGRLEGQRGLAQAFDNDGNLIKAFKGNPSNHLHAQNFIDAIRAGDHTMLNADIQVGHDSTGWCNLANITTRNGQPFTHSQAADIDAEVWTSLVSEMEGLLSRHSLQIESDQISLSPILEVDPTTGIFIGDHAESANALLKREYRGEFVVPEIELAMAE